MHFALPSNLQTELLAYDPKLKALSKQQTASKTTKKAKYPLGNIPCLIPTNVVREADQLAAIEHINQQLAPGRYRVFTTPVDVATPQARLKVIAILYHYEQVWYAAWLPPKKDANQYVYGYAHAFKNTAATAKTAPNWIWTSKDKCTVHENARGSQLFTYTSNVTKEYIATHNQGLSLKRPWSAPSLYNQKGLEIRDNAVFEFEKSLRESIPSWSDTRGLFDRICCKNIFDAAEIPAPMSNHLDESIGLTVENIINGANSFNKANNYASNVYCTISSIQHIISKPAIRKVLQAELDRAIAGYNDPDNTQRSAITQGFKSFLQIVNSIHWVYTIWPDCPLDHYQTYMTELKHLRLNYNRVNNTLIEWLRQHMPVASLFTILRKYLEEARTGRVLNDPEVGYERYVPYELNDTFSMIIRVLENGNTLVPPNRWRINEFHDYVQSEAWKINHPNHKLYQDLFPEPIKVCIDGEVDWTFFQPMDTHQLAMWGKTVRNCVGSASHYATDIKKRKHFIVLCMVASRPMFTIQLEVDNGVMSVKQIAGIANERLTEDMKDEYAAAFRIALQKREKQLQ